MAVSGGPSTTSTSRSLVEIRDLSVAYRTAREVNVKAVKGINVEIIRGEILGVLGESGSGKSTLASALLGLLPSNAELTGSISFGGGELIGADLRPIRGAEIAMIHQDPTLALNPVLRIGAQVEEVLRAHTKLGRSERKTRAKEALRRAQIQDTERIYSSYPHQLSGGERLRVTIAQAIACGPKLVIADEPTSSLDPTIQSAVLKTFSELNRELGMSMLIITHDPAILARIAHRVVVMHRGQIVEQGSTAHLFSDPQHPYTQELIGLIPKTIGAGA